MGSITPIWITNDPSASPHRRWCAADCASKTTGTHTSERIVTADPKELTAVTVRLEQLPETPPITMLAIEFTQDGETYPFLLPIRQGLRLHRAIQQTLTLPYRP